MVETPSYSYMRKWWKLLAIVNNNMPQKKHTFLGGFPTPESNHYKLHFMFNMVFLAKIAGRALGEKMMRCLTFGVNAWLKNRSKNGPVWHSPNKAPTKTATKIFQHLQKQPKIPWLETGCPHQLPCWRGFLLPSNGDIGQQNVKAENGNHGPTQDPWIPRHFERILHQNPPNYWGDCGKFPRAQITLFI